jgi:hypothetical protein
LEKTLKALLAMSWFDFQGPIAFHDKVRFYHTDLQDLYATTTEMPHSPDSLVVPNRSLGEMRLTFEARLQLVLESTMVEGAPLELPLDLVGNMWNSVRPHIVPADVDVVDGGESSSALTNSTQRVAAAAAAAAAAQVTNE